MARIGYRFDGWNTAANGSGTNYVAGDTITLSSDTTLYPIWTTVPTYTLTYSGNGQTTGSVPLSVTTSSGSITLSANINVMTKTNFIFNGWNTAQDGTGTHFDVGAVFSLGANTTLYAEWIPQPYTVTYNANGAASGSVPNATTASGVQTVANNTGSLALPGYLFGGWNTAADGTGTTRAAGTTFTPSSNVTLFARWVTYTITYNSNGASSGSVPAARVGIDSFNISDNTGTLAKTNYFFSGWNTAANGAGTTYAVGQNFTPTANLTLYALWTSNPVYSIIYSANGATSGSAPSTSSAQAGNVTLASNNGGLARTGYTLAGWSTSANGSGTDYALGATFPLSSSVSLYAKWQPIQFLVTYSDSNAESGTAPASGSHNYGSYTISTNTGLLSRNGYVFGGWNTAADGSGTSYPEGSSLNLTSALTLYPVWTLQTFTLSYDANGASSGTVPAQVSSGLGNVAVSTNSGNLNKPGYTFKGWSVSAQNQSSVIVAGASFSLTGNTTLYAVWEAVPASSAAPSVRPEVISISQRVFPLVGGRMKLSGLNLDVLSHVTVNGQRVEILEQNEAEAEVLMPALPAGTYEFVVYAQDFVYFFAQGLSVVPDKVLTFKKVFKLNGKEDYRTKIRMLTFMSDYKKYPYVIFVTGSKYVSKFKLSKLQAQMKAVGISKRWSTTWKRTISVSQTAAKDLGRDSIRLILSYHKPS
jgi:uncharacterized repeat protein (TIGR02543 family)